MDSAGRWEQAAVGWLELVRVRGDPTFSWNWAAFSERLPPPGRLTLDVGCGEGRVTRLLTSEGHHVVGIDAAPSLVAAARDADPEGDYHVGRASSLPFDAGSADLVVSFMTIQDITDAADAIAESARVLAPSGVFALAVLHPIATAGDFEDRGHGARFVLERPYSEPAAVERPLGDATVTQFHRPLEWYAEAMARAGLRIRGLRELATRRRAPGSVPMFLHVHAVRR